MLVLHFPDDEEGFADVFIGGAGVAIDEEVDDFCDGVYENHDVFFEEISEVVEIMDGAKSENSVDFESFGVVFHLAIQT